MKNLDTVYRIQREVAVLQGIISLLDWDLQTYMPKGATINRANQMSQISKEIHEKITSKELRESIDEISKNIDKLSKKDRVVVERLRKDVEKLEKIPVSFMEELSKVTGLAHNAWEEAKEKSDFSIFQPHLEKIVEMKRKQASYLDLLGHPYNSLIDIFEEGMTTEVLAEKFGKLKEGLLTLLEKIKKSDVYGSESLSTEGFSIEVQKEVSNDIIRLMGLPMSKSRIDQSVHPFTTWIGPGDVRITTRYEKDPAMSLLSTSHEAGHAMYQLDLPEEYVYTVVYDGASMGLHESQSRFWENMITKSHLFWEFYFKEFKQKFSKQLEDVSFEKWYNHINAVRPSMIRIKADEVTYCLHVILRFEIEKGLIEGSIEVKDLPKIWNEKMKELLGVEPKNDAEGVLQDVHWSGGMFGYFPSYALGTIYAAQLFDKLMKDQPEAKEKILNGDLSSIKEWLEKNVHSYARTMKADDIVKKVCGEGLNIDKYIEYLNKKYLDIYK